MSRRRVSGLDKSLLYSHYMIAWDSYENWREKLARENLPNIPVFQNIIYGTLMFLYGIRSDPYEAHRLSDNEINV